jgi:hypothetical protein
VEEEDVPVIPLVSTKIQYNTSYEDMNVISQKDDGTAKISSNGTTSWSKNPPDESKGKEDVATESATTQQPFTGLNCSFGSSSSSSSSESETEENDDNDDEGLNQSKSPEDLPLQTVDSFPSDSLGLSVLEDRESMVDEPTSGVNDAKEALSKSRFFTAPSNAIDVNAVKKRPWGNSETSNTSSSSSGGFGSSSSSSSDDSSVSSSESSSSSGGSAMNT